MSFKQSLSRYGTVVRYLIFGVLTTVVSWIVYFGVLFGGKATFEIAAEDTSSGKYMAVYSAAQLLQWAAAVLFAFFTNKKWVFDNADERRSTLKQLAVFAGGRVVTFFLDYGITYFGALLLCKALPSLSKILLWGREWNVNEISAKLVAAVIVVITNYFFSKLLVFKKPKKNIPKENEK